MMDWIKGFWKGLIEEIFMRKKAGSNDPDTFFWWVVHVCIFIGFYLYIYDFDARGVETDKWFHEVFGWELSDIPSAGKVAWHRLTAGIMACGGVFFVTLIYAHNVYRRIKARIAASKAKKAAANSKL